MAGHVLQMEKQEMQTKFLLETSWEKSHDRSKGKQYCNIKTDLKGVYGEDVNWFRIKYNGQFL